MKRPERKWLSSLPSDVIEMIFSYLTEDEKQHACVFYKTLFRGTRSIVYHVDAISSTWRERKRKRSSTTADLFNTYHESAGQLIQNPQSAAQLQDITLSSPFDYGDLSVDLPVAQFYDERKFGTTSLIAKDSHVDRVLGMISQNAQGLRFFETNLSRPLKPLLQALPDLEELKIPSTTSLEAIALPSLRKLTIFHTSMTETPASLPKIPSLTSLEIQLRYFIKPPRLPTFVNLNCQPNLRDLLLMATVPALNFHPIFKSHSM